MNATEAPGGLASLAADFPGWHFWRSRDGRGREGDWNATRRRGAGSGGGPRRVTAAGADSLRCLLEQREAEAGARTAGAA